MKTAESVLKSARENREPVFVIRAKDDCSIAALLKYVKECKVANCSVDHIMGVENVIDDFVYWRHIHSDQIRNPD